MTDTQKDYANEVARFYTRLKKRGLKVPLRGNRDNVPADLWEGYCKSQHPFPTPWEDPHSERKVRARVTTVPARLEGVLPPVGTEVLTCPNGFKTRRMGLVSEDIDIIVGDHVVTTAAEVESRTNMGITQYLEKI